MTYTFCEKYNDPKYGVKVFENFVTKFGNNVVAISGPYITPANGADRIPDYFITGSVVINNG